MFSSKIIWFCQLGNQVDKTKLSYYCNVCYVTLRYGTSWASENHLRILESLASDISNKSLHGIDERTLANVAEKLLNSSSRHFPLRARKTWKRWKEKWRRKRVFNRPFSNLKSVPLFNLPFEKLFISLD